MLFRSGQSEVLLWMSVGRRALHGDTSAGKVASFADELSVVVSWDLVTIGKDADDAVEGASFHADGKKGVVALVGEGGAWHGVDLVHVVLDVVLSRGSADDSLLTDVSEVGEKVILIELVLVDAKKAAKKVGT